MERLKLALGVLAAYYIFVFYLWLANYLEIGNIGSFPLGALNYLLLASLLILAVVVAIYVDYRWKKHASKPRESQPPTLKSG